MVKSFMRTVRAWRKHVQAFLLASCIGAAVLAPCASVAQNLGTNRQPVRLSRVRPRHNRKAHF